MAFGLSHKQRAQYAIKSGNLAASFLGFAAHSNEETYSRSAQLGFLASAFDLVSDNLQYDQKAKRLFECMARQDLGEPAAANAMSLMERKQGHVLQSCGLERGVDAFRIIISHLGIESHWNCSNEIEDTGLLLQIVDDVLDCEGDMSRGELNFLGFANSPIYLHKLVTWSYRERFCYCASPRVLFDGIKKAQKKGKLLQEELPALGAVRAQRSVGS